MKNQIVRALGIDLGTRYTMAAVWGDPPKTISLGEGEPAVPTCLVPYEGEWLYGTLARQAYEAGEEPGYNIRQGLQAIYGGGEKAGDPREGYVQEWLLYILKEVEYRIRHSGFSLAITVPYTYLDPPRRILFNAAVKTGVDGIILIHELLACAIAWRLKNPLSSEPGKAVLLSLGAGFTESAAAHISNDEIRIMKAFTNRGMEGGNLCDLNICMNIMDQLSENNARDLLFEMDDRERAPFSSKVEKMRCMLSRRHSARLAAYIGNRKVETEITRDQLNQWMDSYFEGVDQLTRQALEDLSSECDVLLLSGRMAETPMLLERISRLVGKSPILLPQDSPAIGAAYMARHFLGDRMDSTPRIIDTLPHPLNLIIPGGKDVSLHCILKQGESLDLAERSVSRKLPLASKSERVQVEILQGESMNAIQYHRTRFEVSGVQPDDHGIKHIEMNLEIDQNGIFSCHFHDRISRKNLQAHETAPEVPEPRYKDVKIIKTIPIQPAIPIKQEFPPEEKAELVSEEKPKHDKPTVLLVKRSFACIEESLQKRNIGYEVLTPRQADLEDFSWDRFQLVILTSSSQFDRYMESISQRLESFVHKGGHALILDWASVYIIKSFPGYLALHEEPHIGMAAYIDAEVLDEKLGSQIGSRVNLDLSTGAWDPIHDLLRPGDAHVFLTGSYEVRNNMYQENKPLAVSFPYGKGRFFFSVLNEESFSSSTGLKLLDFFLDHILS